MAAKAEQVLAEAGELDPEIRHFGPLARKYSDDRASRYQGGVIGWLVRHPGRESKWEREVTDAVFALREPGEIAPLIRTDKGYYLVRLVDREGSETRPLEQLAPNVRHRLLREKQARLRAELLTEVLSQVAVEVDEALLATMAPPTPAAAEGEREPPPLPAD